MRGRYADFAKEEFEERYARARKFMDEKDMDALLITERLNYAYFSGHRSEQNIIDKIRPYVFILPREGEPVLITMKFEMEQVDATTYVEDVRPAGLADRAEVIVEVLRDLGLSEKRIGAEMGPEQSMGVTYEEFQTIRSQLSGATFVDASEMILKLRAIKSPQEQKYISRAGSIVAESMTETFANIRSGMTELEVATELRRLIASKGGERQTFSWVVSSADGMIAHPTQRKIVAGDVLVLDCGVEFHGYGSDVSRTAFVGEPSNRAADCYNWQTELTRYTTNFLRVGNTIGDLVRASNEMCAERGLVPAIAGRLGHGVGLESTEYPSLTLSQDIPIEAGMVFACNPNFFWDGIGWINNEDNWAVTDTEGPRLLSEPIAPETLLIVEP